MNTKKWYIDRAIVVLKSQNDIVFAEDLAPELPISMSGYYKKGLHKVESIKELLKQNQRRMKRAMRTKWFQSDNATLQIALYRIMSTDEELKKLIQNRVDLTSKDEEIKLFTVEIIDSINNENTSNSSITEDTGSGEGL